MRRHTVRKKERSVSKSQDKKAEKIAGKWRVSSVRCHMANAALSPSRQSFRAELTVEAWRQAAFKKNMTVTTITIKASTAVASSILRDAIVAFLPRFMHFRVFPIPPPLPSITLQGWEIEEEENRDRKENTHNASACLCLFVPVCLNWEEGKGRMERKTSSVEPK